MAGLDAVRLSLQRSKEYADLRNDVWTVMFFTYELPRNSPFYNTQEFLSLQRMSDNFHWLDGRVAQPSPGIVWLTSLPIGQLPSKIIEWIALQHQTLKDTSLQLLKARYAVLQAPIVVPKLPGETKQPITDPMVMKIKSAAAAPETQAAIFMDDEREYPIADLERVVPYIAIEVKDYRNAMNAFVREVPRYSTPQRNELEQQLIALPEGVSRTYLKQIFPDRWSMIDMQHPELNIRFNRQARNLLGEASSEIDQRK